MARLFVALELPAGFLDKVVGLRDRALPKPLQETMRPIPEENLHLTLRFLGDTDEAAIEDLGTALAKAASNHGAIPVLLTGGGCFPHTRSPRVLWAGIEAPEGGLTELHRSVSDELARLGLPREDKPFHPHVTLGYLRKGVNLGEARRAAAALTRFAESPVGAQTVLDTLALKRSHLDRAGAVHTVLETIRLGS